MTEQQIKDEVLRYIDDNSYNYAILIDGEWGCGKTHFVTNVLFQEIKKYENCKDKPRDIKYISLYGCKTVSDVQENIAWSFAENARAKISDKTNMGMTTETVSGNLLLSSKKIGNAILKKLLPEASIYEITTDWLNLGQFIFVFDDLERCDCPHNEVFGFLNELVEHGNIKVIVVANEKEISGVAEPQYLELQYFLALDKRIDWPKDEQNRYARSRNQSEILSLIELERRRKILFPQKDANAEYKRIREKLIGVTLQYKPDIPSIISEIILKLKCDEEIKSMLLEKVPLFSYRMDYYRHHNLRTFQFFLSKVTYLLERLSEVQVDDTYKGKICEQIITETFLQAVKFKANYQIPQEDSIGLRAEQNTTSILIKKYVEKGEFEVNALKKDVLLIQEQLKASIPSDDAYYLLYQQYYFHTQKWCEEQLEILIKQLENNRYPVSFYSRIIIVVQRLLDLGFDNNYMERVKNCMKTNISSMGEVDSLYEDLWMLDNSELKEKISIIMAEINDVITTHSEQARCINVKEILKESDWIERLGRYINPDDSYSSRDIPVFSKGEVKEWVNRLQGAEPELIDNFRYWLNQAYPQNQFRNSYLEDATSIKEIKRELEKIEDSDLIKKANIRWLIQQFDNIIRCNEPEQELKETDNEPNIG